MWQFIFHQLVVISILILASFISDGQGQCTDSEGCFPPIGDIVLGRNISVTSTCTTNSTNEGQMCDPSLMNDDNSSTAWVSDIIPEPYGNDSTLGFIIELNFERPMWFYNTSITWESSVPIAMSLERNNGSGWITYRYYSTNCMGYYDLEDAVIIPGVIPDQEPVCTSMGHVNADEKTIAFNTYVYDNPSADYQLITGLRIVVDGIYNNSMTEGVLSRQLSISEWSAQGTCMCNGHASECHPADGESENQQIQVYSGCLCSHNTTGINCQSCETGYNDQEWAPGNETNANECEACQCNGHADDCTYDPDLMMGVCIDCRDNTEGQDCSLCRDTYYPDSSLMVIHQNYCQACECNEVGITDNGSCSNNGECNCKANVASTKCSTCQNGYWNLTKDNPEGCQLCDCGDGTEVSNGLKSCDVHTGVCKCLSDNVEGERCDTCVDGKYDLLNGCSKECGCTDGGAVNASCDPVLGQCYCKDNIIGTVCAEVVHGYYYKVLDDITLEAEDTDSNLALFVPSESDGTFSGRGYRQFPSSGATLVFTSSVDISIDYFIVLRFKSAHDISSVTIFVDDEDVANYTLLATETSEPNEEVFITDSTTEPISLSAGEIYEIRVVYYPDDGQGFEWMIDSIVLLPDITTNGIYTSVEHSSCLPLSLPVTRGLDCDFNTFRFSLLLNEQVFKSDEPNFNGITSGSEIYPPHGQIHNCQPGYTGALCFGIANGYYRNASTGLHEACPAVVCDSIGSFSAACNESTGMCDCKRNVGGEACDRCISGHYNLTTSGCQDCGCYGSDQTCNNQTGVCDCPDTTSGSNCDTCANGYYNLTVNGCTPCNCNPYGGSSSESCNNVTGECTCTGNAMGQQCTECPSGYYTANNSLSQDYCTKCFCFNHTTQCEANTNHYTVTEVSSDFVEACNNDPGEGCQMNWTLQNMDQQLIPSDDGLLYLVYNEPGAVFISPSNYHGDFRLAYGRNITIIFRTDIESPTYEENFVRLDSPEQTIYASFTPPIIESSNIYTFEIPLLEEYWHVNSVDGRQANISDLIGVLSNIQNFLFTGIFSSEFVNLGYLQFVRIEYITLSTNSTQSTIIAENCSCPDGHLGPFCDECTEGYYREVDNPVAPCIQCDCNGLATSCATPTGTCNNCTGNSTGDDCGQCLEGYYGNPRNNQPCYLCDCNSHSQTCDINGVCDNCTEEYRGNHCELCANGYYREDGSDVCVPCDCSGNADTSVDPFCHNVTGHCLECINNFDGTKCDACADGYYRVGSLCVACDCDPSGTTPDICDKTTGECFCSRDNTTSNCSQCLDGFYSNKTNNETCTLCPCPLASNSHAISCSQDPNNTNHIICICQKKYTGELCDQCEEGYFGNPIIGICNDCQCNGNSDECDMETGFCMNCSNHTYGGECENCENGYYGDPAHGIPCQPCSHCSINGTVDEICDMVSGICHCREGVIGQNCTECAVGEFGAPDIKVECQPCSDYCLNTDNPECHLSGDLSTLICNCGKNYTGQLCENCANGFYNDSFSTKCVACNCNGNVDPNLGQLVCDPSNGTCMNCLNNTKGSYCEECADGYYGDVPNGIYCQKCNCNEGNTVSGICNSSTGECFCKPFFNSTNGCDMCIAEYWGVNECVPCNCCTIGSESAECNQMTGQCSCKDGVDSDEQCCECQDGYYNLTSTGCTACGCVSSVGQSCDENGRCVCKTGVSGDKCDRCKYGYTSGEFPDCTICHDCFFLWNNLLNDTNQNITSLLEEIQTLLGYYETFDEESVLNASKLLETAIININQTLQTIHIDEQQLTNISTTLLKVSDLHAMLNLRIYSLNHSLNDTMKRLKIAKEFIDDMAQMEINNLNEISQNITSLVEMAEMLQSQATASSQLIHDNEQDILALQEIVNSLPLNISMDSQSLQTALNKSNVSKTIAEMAATFSIEISLVNTEIMLVEKKVNDFESRLLDGEMSIEELVDEINMLDETLAMFNEQLSLISGLSQVLEDSAAAIEMQANMLLSDTNKLTVSTNATLEAAQSLLIMIGVAGDHVNQTSQDLIATKEVASRIDVLQAPSLDEATTLAKGINESIIPEEEVTEVLKDANESSTKANTHLQRAINASEKVSEVEDLITYVEANKSQLNDSVVDVQEGLSISSDNAENIKYLLEEVENTLDASSDSADQQHILQDTSNGLESGKQKLQYIEEEAQTVVENSKTIRDHVTEESKKLQTEETKLNETKLNATSDYMDSLDDLSVAKEAKSMAEESKAEANKAPSLQDLEALLTKYKEKLEEVTAAKDQINTLNENLEGMVSAFNEASKKYKTCYKTP